MHVAVHSRILLAVVILTASAATATAQTGRVGGLVKDDSGQPIKSAIVTAQFLDANANDVTATTDERGRFAMVGLRFGAWMFRVQAPGFMGQTSMMNVRTGGINPPMSFALAKTYETPSALGTMAPRDLQSSLANADSLYDNQRWDDAIAAYRAVLVQAPSLTAINLQIAAAFRNKKDFDNAIAAYNEVLKTDPRNSKAQVGVAATNVEKGDLTTALNAMEQASKEPEATREIFYGLGEIRAARSENDDAIKAYARAAEVDPTWGKPQLALARLAMAKGDRDIARKYLQTVVQVDPASPEATKASELLQQLGR